MFHSAGKSWLFARYSEDLNTDHLNTGNIWIPTFLELRFQMVGLFPVYKTDHSNTGPVHKKTRWRAFVLSSDGWAVRFSNGIQLPYHLVSNLFLTCSPIQLHYQSLIFEHCNTTVLGSLLKHIIAIVLAQPVENRTIYNPIFKKKPIFVCFWIING